MIMRRNDEPNHLSPLQGDLLRVYEALIALEEPVTIDALSCASGGTGAAGVASLIEHDLIPLGLVRIVSRESIFPAQFFYQAIGEPVIAFDANKIRQDAVVKFLLADNPEFLPLTVNVCLRLDEHKRLLDFGVDDELYYRLAATCLSVGRTAVPDFERAAQCLNLGKTGCDF